MNTEERYLFDLQGFLAVENLLPPEHVAKLNRIFDEKIKEEVEPGATRHGFTHVVEWGKPYLDVIDNPRLKTYLDPLLQSKYRLDHDYAFLRRYEDGASPQSHLHLGATPRHPACFYTWQNDNMYNGLIVVAFALTDANAGDGGFTCIPGSHKSNLPIPEGWSDLNNPCPVAHQVPVKAGGAILFTETHSATFPCMS